MGSINWLLATHNPGKIRELRRILMPFPIKLQSLGDRAIRQESPETGASFLENAMQKAKFYFDLTGIPVLADDSGLEVDALNGAPGIHSARFGGLANHAQKIDYLLELIADVPDPYRTARFCCAAVFFDGMRYLSARASVEGYLGWKPIGDGGFGYDPIFLPQAGGPSFAQLEPAQKDRMSHRGKAFHSLVKAIHRFECLNL